MALHLVNGREVDDGMAVPLSDGTFGRLSIAGARIFVELANGMVFRIVAATGAPMTEGFPSVVWPVDRPPSSARPVLVAAFSDKHPEVCNWVALDKHPAPEKLTWVHGQGATVEKWRALEVAAGDWCNLVGMKGLHHDILEPAAGLYAALRALGFGKGGA